ncbi:unnamed protein product [Lepeophtheirus salmonis]|uniref:(salmon louse) hypothetical protein n=1 Tax=Lepeophtheirus salmonis TaxID=72036 RepID=A0A7R8CGP1_LEPSM|nr:unnamed protein product [Lepeophtheirus salmonis]CAF2817616.1 unnamed protein product [Lepeophtheirus salmonis]
MRTNKVNQLLAGVKKQLSTFSQIQEVSEASVKAIYLIDKEIILTSKQYYDGDFIEKFKMKASELNTDLLEDFTSNLKQRVGRFVAFSVSIYEITDTTDVAQLAICSRGVDNTLTVTDEFVDIFISVVAALDNVGVDWSRAVSIATDGAPSMMGKKGP